MMTLLVPHDALSKNAIFMVFSFFFSVPDRSHASGGPGTGLTGEPLSLKRGLSQPPFLLEPHRYTNFCVPGPPGSSLLMLSRFRV